MPAQAAIRRQDHPEVRDPVRQRVAVCLIGRPSPNTGPEVARRRRERCSILGAGRLNWSSTSRDSASARLRASNRGPDFTTFEMPQEFPLRGQSAGVARKGTPNEPKMPARVTPVPRTARLGIA